MLCSVVLCCVVLCCVVWWCAGSCEPVHARTQLRGDGHVCGPLAHDRILRSFCRYTRTCHCYCTDTALHSSLLHSTPFLRM
jgi:hypothetical protein